MEARHTRNTQGKDRCFIVIRPQMRHSVKGPQRMHIVTVWKVHKVGTLSQCEGSTKDAHCHSVKDPQRMHIVTVWRINKGCILSQCEGSTKDAYCHNVKDPHRMYIIIVTVWRINMGCTLSQCERSRKDAQWHRVQFDVDCDYKLPHIGQETASLGALYYPRPYPLWRYIHTAPRMCAVCVYWLPVQSNVGSLKLSLLALRYAYMCACVHIQSRDCLHGLKPQVDIIILYNL